MRNCTPFPLIVLVVLGFLAGSGVSTAGRPATGPRATRVDARLENVADGILEFEARSRTSADAESRSWERGPITIGATMFPSTYWLYEPRDVIGPTVARLLLEDLDLYLVEARDLIAAKDTTPYARLVVVASRCSTVLHILLGGFHGGRGVLLWAVVLDPDDEIERRVRKFLGCLLSFDPGSLREWTDAEVCERRPIELVGSQTLRTDHYLIIGVHPHLRFFARDLEANYELLKQTFGIEETGNERLMPVLVFSSLDCYRAFCRRTKPEIPRFSVGHAAEDYFAVFYNHRQHRAHGHEQMHQLVVRRMGLRGGGSWFHEGLAGLAEIVLGRPSAHVSEVAACIARGDFIPLRDLVLVERLADRADHCEAYAQAALFMQWLQTEPRGISFERALQVFGNIGTRDLDDFEAGFRQLGLPMDDAERAFVTYCAKQAVR